MLFCNQLTNQLGCPPHVLTNFYNYISMVGMNIQEPKVALVTGIPAGTAFEAAIILARCGMIHMILFANLRSKKI
jgi:hypothetical protein